MAEDAAADEGGFKLYHYTPTFVGAVIFAILFAAASIRHAHIIVREKTWFFIPFLVGCLCKLLRLRRPGLLLMAAFCQSKQLDMPPEAILLSRPLTGH